MRKPSRCFSALAPALAWLAAGMAAPVAIAQVGDAGSAGQAKLATYQPSAGETYYALSLSPAANVFQGAASAEGVDVVMLVDTSASQTGPYRTDTLTAVRTLLSTLGPRDRVKLMAVDLNAIDLSRGFVAPGSREMQAALAQLDRRTPLGSTDMAVALRAAAASLPASLERPRAVVYLGDGMSKGNLLGADDFRALVNHFVENQAAVHSYAIGPQRDMHFLATLANHTGGMMYADSAEPNAAQQAGTGLALVVRAPVFWPADSALPATFKEVYPERVPPLRSDRDTILIGTLDGDGPQTVSLRGKVNGAVRQASWTVTPENSADDLAFLPKVMELARLDGGLSLPTAGSAGLREVGRMVLDEAGELAKKGARELSGGNVTGAKRFADAARRADPNNPDAKALENAVKKSGAGVKIHPIHFQPGAAAPPAAPPPPAPAEPPAGFGEGFGPDRGEFLESALERRRIEEQILTAEVEEAIRQARGLMGTAPERVIQDLKLLLQSVEAARDVSAELRVQLRNQVLDVIQEAGRTGIELTERRAAAEARRSAAIQQQRLTEALLRDQERIASLMLRFNALMDEGEYVVAEQELAAQVIDIVERSPTPMTRAEEVGIAALRNARFIGNYEAIMAIRDERERNVFNTLLLVEQSHIPFPDEPPIVYPPADFWEDLTIRRKKYASIDLAQQGSAEEKIFAALEGVATLEFIETPLSDVVEFLKDTHQIPIEIDTKALDDVGLSTDVPVTRNLKGITLRSALRLMLRELELTYMVRDEVLLITTPEEAETQLITKVYPVADLVLPIMSQGLDPFSGGGGLGGGGNFNGGGGGFGGGGFGGGGFGGGGFGGGGFGGGGFGGGFFDVKDRLTDDLNLGVKKTSSIAAPAKQPAPAAQSAPRVERPAARPAKKAAPVTVVPQPGETVADAWDRCFAEAKQPLDQAAVRESTRRLMKQQKFDDVIALTNAAIRHGQAQPWMYEAMGLAMQAAGAPQEELERALMSAVDWSADLDTVMYVAAYLARVGLDARALSLFRDVATAAPNRHEPYVHGLAVAERINDRDGVQWACLGILNQAWPKDQRETAERAARVAEALVIEMRQAGETEQAEKFEQAIRAAQARDVRIVVTWTGDADIDLLVEEPSGMVCSLRNQRTTGGGVLLGDTYASAKGAGVEGYREVYECPQGFTGVYRLLVRRIWGKPTAGQVNLDIYTHYGSENEEHIRKQIPIGEKDALVIFDLMNGRRQESLEEAQIENLAKAQVEIDRAMLAQQLSQSEDSSASRALAADRGRAVRSGVLPAGPRRGVGYRPVITTLPEGTNFSATAVISADRRYVRITATPLFSLVGDVTTFNFATGNTGNN